MFWHHGDTWTPRTFFMSPWKLSEWQNSQPVPSSSSPSPSPPSPQSLARGIAGKALPVGILSMGIGLYTEKFRVETSLSPLFLPLGLRQPCITVHTVSASCGPSQLLLYLRKAWEIWCITVRLHSFSWIKRGMYLTQQVFTGVHLSQVPIFLHWLERSKVSPAGGGQDYPCLPGTGNKNLDTYALRLGKRHNHTGSHL